MVKHKSKIRKVGKYIQIFMVSAIIFMMSAFPVCAAPSSGGISMEVAGGYQDVARVNSPAPFVITLENSGDELNGEVQVLVDINPESRSIYSMPVTLPKGSKKEVTLYAPIFTANRKVEVRFVRNNKVVSSVKYSFKKLIPPGNPVIGVLSDDAEALRELNAIKLPEGLAGAESTPERIKLMIAAGEIVAEADMPAELIRIDRNMLPDDAENLNCFDIIVMCNFDTSTLSEKQNKALEEWVNDGNMLFLCTGPNASKVYAGLKDSLKPFRIDSQKTIPVPEAIGAFIEKESPAGDLYVAVGSADEKAIILGDRSMPLAVSYMAGKGTITVLSFDPSLSPISTWDQAPAFWRKLIGAAADKNSGALANQQNPYYQMAYRGYEDMASSVPETNTPPFTMLLVLTAVYVVVAGPLVYLFLKWKDKRELNWLAVPAAAFVFLTVIYIAGFKTRYTTAVLNAFSIINLDSERGRADIETVMGAFNNRRGNMKLEYDSSAGYKVNPNRYYYDYYSYSTYSPTVERDTRIIGKFSYGNPYTYELYDVSMWEPRYIYATRSEDFEGSIINSVSIKDGEFKATVRNTSGFDLREAFLVFGDNFIDVGTLLPGEEKQINVKLNDPAVKKDYEDFMTDRYGQYYYQQPQNRPPDWREKNRMRRIFDALYDRVSNTGADAGGGIKVMLLALNFDDMGYQLEINDKQPKKFHTNAVYTVMNNEFEKGVKVEIPTGVIKPVQENINEVQYYGRYSSAVMALDNKDIAFRFVIPENIIVESFKIYWSEYKPLNLKYNPQATSQQTSGKDPYILYIYNNNTSQWVEFDFTFETGSNAQDFINDKGEIALRAQVNPNGGGVDETMLEFPRIELKGVVR